MNSPAAWYIVKQPDGHCEIVTAPVAAASPSNEEQNENQWGPYASQAEAIARRVGLIRAGKCQPV